MISHWWIQDEQFNYHNVQVKIVKNLHQKHHCECKIFCALKFLCRLCLTMILKDHSLVKSFGAYNTLEQHFFHNFQAQSGRCVLYTSAYFIPKNTVVMVSDWWIQDSIQLNELPPSMRKDLRAESLADGSLSGTRGGGSGFRGSFWSFVRHCWSSDRWSGLTDLTGRGCLIMTWSGYTIGLIVWGAVAE